MKDIKKRRIEEANNDLWVEMNRILGRDPNQDWNV